MVQEERTDRWTDEDRKSDKQRWVPHLKINEIIAIFPKEILLPCFFKTSLSLNKSSKKKSLKNVL